jgi:hypothetical protein
MTDQTKAIVRRVLQEAADAPHFFDFSEKERSEWLIKRAYTHGQQDQRPMPKNASRRKRRPVKRRTSPRAVLSIVVKSH